MAKLFLVRHGKSEWNKLGQWTGWTDVSLAEEGHIEARRAGEALQGEDIHKAYTSMLKRTHETFEGIRQGLGMLSLSHTSHEPLNERDYGVHTGKNKWQVKEEVGEEEFQRIRRGWDVPILDGETLKDVYTRVIPFYTEQILADLWRGENVLIVSHGNTLRALIKHLDDLDEIQICDVEVETGEVHCYLFDESGKVVGKEVRHSK
ncbi:MAG: 2,3-bisphosphoglycerate-dependent phosphoglycerate mutase [Patescibacteria group bacterium]